MEKQGLPAEAWVMGQVFVTSHLATRWTSMLNILPPRPMAILRCVGQRNIDCSQ